LTRSGIKPQTQVSPVISTPTLRPPNKLTTKYKPQKGNVPPPPPTRLPLPPARRPPPPPTRLPLHPAIQPSQQPQPQPISLLTKLGQESQRVRTAFNSGSLGPSTEV